MTTRSIPDDAPIRVVGDVHGDATAFRYAAATDRFVVQLGDLTDYGPDNAGALRIMSWHGWTRHHAGRVQCIPACSRSP